MVKGSGCRDLCDSVTASGKMLTDCVAPRKARLFSYKAQRVLSLLQTAGIVSLKDKGSVRTQTMNKG
eukprot:1356044-Amphidinium_carterae.1